MIVVDATILSNLALANRVSLLEIYGKILIPSQVHEEILKGLSAGYDFLNEADAVVEAEWVDLVLLQTKKSRALYKNLLDVLGYGEAAAIAIAKERSILFASDDRKARRVALEQGVKITGTLGMLKLALDMDKITLQEGDRILSKMIQGGYHSPIRSMRELISPSGAE